MSESPSSIEFDPRVPDALLSVMGEIKGGLGWCNVLPGVVEEDADRVPSVGIFSALFGPPPPLVAMGTWLPDKAGKSGRMVRVGLLHAAGRLGLDGQRALGGGIPTGWKVTQDHARRGLVLAVPLDVADREVVAWLLAAISQLTKVRTQSPWLAEVFRRG